MPIEVVSLLELCSEVGILGMLCFMWYKIGRVETAIMWIKDRLLKERKSPEG